jgi:cobalt-zinc-cadmium efflux system protein
MKYKKVNPKASSSFSKAVPFKSARSNKGDSAKGSIVDQSRHKHGHGHHHHGPGHINCGLGAVHGGEGSQIGFAFFLNLSFSIIEIIGGLLTGSYAILADALHDAGDSLTFGIAWLLERYSRKSKDQKFTYGYARYSLLGSMIVSMVIVLSSIAVVYGAISRLFNPVAPATLPMMGFALLGVLVNGYAYFKMSRSSHYLDKNLKWHMFEDAAGWVAVLMGAIVIHYTGWLWIDPILAIAIAIFVSVNVCKGFGRTLDILLQAKPEEMNVDEIKSVISSIPGVVALHDLHVWSLNGMTQILTAHVVAENLEKAPFLKDEIRKRLANIGSFHCTIEVESNDEFCKDQC